MITITRKSSRLNKGTKLTNEFTTPIQRVTRNNPVTCIDFGVDRIEKYVDGHFCSQCFYYEQRLLEVGISKHHLVNRNSRTYKCTISHPSKTTPRKKKRIETWVKNCCSKSECEDYEFEDNDDHISPRAISFQEPTPPIVEKCNKKNQLTVNLLVDQLLQ